MAFGDIGLNALWYGFIVWQIDPKKSFIYKYKTSGLTPLVKPQAHA